MLAESSVPVTDARLSVTRTPIDARGSSMKRELPQIPDWQTPGHRLSSAISEQTSQLYAVVGELVEAGSDRLPVSTAATAAISTAVSAVSPAAADDAEDADLAAGYQTLTSVTARADMPATALTSRSQACRSLNRADENDSTDNSTSTDEVIETIPARLAVSGGVSASLELPYMTPPALSAAANTAAVTSDGSNSNNNNAAAVVAAQLLSASGAAAPVEAAGGGVTHAVYFSGDSVQSADSRGYTRITVRQPLSELLPSTAPSGQSPTLQTSSSSTARTAVTAVPSTGSSSSVSSQRLPPAASSTHTDPAVPLYADVCSHETNLYSTVDEEVGDNLYEAIGSRQMARCIIPQTQPTASFSASVSSLTQCNMGGADGESGALVAGTSTCSLSPGCSDRRACLQHQHSRQSSHSGLTSRCSASSMATVAPSGSCAADSHTGRTPFASPLTQQQLDLMYARVQRPPTSNNPKQLLPRSTAVNTSMDSQRSCSSLLAAVDDGEDDDNDGIEPNYACIGAATDSPYSRVNHHGNHHLHDDDDDDEDEDDEYARIRCRVGSFREGVGGGVDRGPGANCRRSHLYERVRGGVGCASEPFRGSQQSAHQPQQSCVDSLLPDHLYSRIGEPPYAKANTERSATENGKRCTSLPPPAEIDARVSQLYARVQKRNHARAPSSSGPSSNRAPSPLSSSSPLPPPLPPPLLNTSVESIAAVSASSEQTVYYL